MRNIPITFLARKRAYPDANVEKCSKGRGRPNNEVVRSRGVSEEDELNAREGLLLICWALDFWTNIENKPFFLRRCLKYNIQAKRENRMVVTVSLSWNHDVTQSLFPLCLCLARTDPSDKTEEGEPKYHVIRKFTFGGSSKIDENGKTQVQTNFVIPKLIKEAKYCALILASAENPISLSDVNEKRMPWDVASNESRGGEKCLYRELSLMDLHAVWDMHSHVTVKKRFTITYFHTFLPCILKYCFQGKNKCISIKDHSDSQNERDLKKLRISVSTSSP